MVRLRDPSVLKGLREGRPDEKGRTRADGTPMWLTQRQVARHIGIDFSHYAKIEHGDAQPSLRVAERIAAFFNVSLVGLFDEIPLEYGEPDDGDAA